MRLKSPRIAVRALLLHRDRLLLVNAYPGGQSPLMCAPGGGAEIGASLPDNLRREIHEETGLRIEVGAPCLVNEFHDPDHGFHQVDIYFRCTVQGSAQISPDWRDPEEVVNRHRWVTREELRQLPHKPDSLGPVAWGEAAALSYDPLELILR